ncbi:non-ribosomal peptide synthetase [Streptomyces caatingaensis]|uniref:Thioester reductase n=1 Tax=Streptomyces caatingaensis TaxID=1678637 RepID=A0A0K9XAV8_9ACTN|nr:non-ribosomal peptide synthetase [Streptomyces caatingaensis]KNB50555.1 thioester reductase [Streptomyces caatingaensis]
MPTTKSIEDIYELTPIQQGLLFEQLARPEAGVYIEQLLLTFDGTLHPEPFGRAWQMVVDRHPILRTSFHWRDEGLPLQVVHRHAELPLEVLDWRDVPQDGQRRRFEEWLDRERVEGFDLTRAPLMRIGVVRTAPEQWVFVWRLSHLLMDGWSFGLAVGDFIDCYRGLCLGHEPERRPMRPYRDYAAWWARQDAAADREFWAAELAGFTPPEPLRLGGRPPAPGEPSHGFVELDLSDIEPAVRALSRTHQLTLNTIVQGAWLLVLSHHYGTDDVLCGFTMAHRPGELRGSETILGPLISTMPVRERLEPHRTALAWLRDFQVHIAAVREHTGMPLFDVQRLAGLPLDVPLLESSVSYENMPMPDFALQETGMKLSSMRYDGRPHYPITMVIMPGEGMPLRVIHDRGRISPEAAQRFCDQLRTVLTRMATSPELTLGELSPGAGAAAPVPAPAVRLETEEATLHGTFARHAARTPDAEALSYQGTRLTYRQLDERGDAVAGLLAGAGVRPGDRVGLCLDRGPDLIAAMLGVFKAGAAYVPLDPAHPAARLAWTVRDAAPAAVLTTPGRAGLLGDFDGPVLEVRDDLALPAGPALPETGPDTPAYVLHTSGSTGRPKAVVVTHRNVQSLLAAGRALFGFGADDVWTCSHSFGFDYSVWEIWGALGNGARLVLVPPETVRSPGDYHALVRDERVTVSSQTPTLFEHFAAADEAAGDPLALRHVFLGGDRLTTAVLRPWIERHGDRRPRVHNLYGVTEATVVSTWHTVTADEVLADAPVPIGRALPNQRAYLLDERGRAVAEGTRGELCVAGPAVAAGYHDREELTARRFGTEPAPPGERLYRTGDFARALPDGTLQYLGRDDTQVKIRGHRVELGEVEAALRAHPAVRSAVAVVRDDGGGGRIVGYGVPAATRVPEDEVRADLGERLPAHMVPSAFVWLDALPVAVGGKVDVRSLPAPAAHRPAGRAEPRTPLERELAALVARLAGLPEVGPDDRFADLGLHSAHLMRLMTTLSSRWDAAVPLREIYASPTVAALARLVERARKEQP